jgi:DNA-binding transcriptional LysR family regulator
VCSLPTLAADPTSELVGRFRRLHPGVRVDLAAPEDSQDLFDLVEDGTCELGLTDAVHVPESFDSIEFGSQSLVFIHPPGTASAGADGDGTVVRNDTPLIAAPEGTSTRRLLEEQLDALRITPMLAVVSAQREAIIPLVLAGAGAALVPDALARFAEQFGAVVSRPEPPVVRRLALVHRAGDLSPAAARFCELVGPPNSAGMPGAADVDR